MAFFAKEKNNNKKNVHADKRETYPGKCGDCHKCDVGCFFFSLTRK